jgi:hypothetical protein
MSMNNDKTIEIIKAVGSLGFTVIEVKQENHDGYAEIVKNNGRGTTGTILVRMVPENKD